MSRWRRQLFIGAALSLFLGGGAVGPDSVLAACTPPTTAGDPSYCSTNYGIVESELGATGDYNSASTNYRNTPGSDDSGSTLGDNFIGNSSSTSYQTNSGFNTTAQPGLTFNITKSVVDLGALTTASRSTDTATFNVKDYTSYGYVVTVVGTPPAYAGHQLTALATDTASAAGTEQFGINLVLNPTAPASGADPVQDPNGLPSQAFGAAGDGSTGTFGTNRPYTVPNKWRFVSGEVVASSPKSSGETDYTMTFMSNISALTPGGKYTGNLTLIATGTY